MVENIECQKHGKVKIYTVVLSNVDDKFIQLCPECYKDFLLANLTNYNA